MPIYKRVLLKISGEGFCHEGSFGIEGLRTWRPLPGSKTLKWQRMGVQLAIVVGGGNFIRGATFAEDGNIPRATADYMGMLATVLNAVALQETMEKMGQPTRVQSAISVYSIAEPFIRRRAVRHLEKRPGVDPGGGDGKSFFYDRYVRRVAGDGDRRGCFAEGDQGGRRLQLVIPSIIRRRGCTATSVIRMCWTASCG